MAEQEKGSKIRNAAVAWIVIACIVAAGWKYGVPYFKSWMDKRAMEQTGTDSQYKNEIKFMADSFSGYGVLRSDVFQNQLKKQGTRPIIVDDGADYGKRIRALKSGKAQLAVFTIDSLVTACQDLGELPGTIVSVIDESKGADAIVAYKDAVSSIEDLDDKNAKFVLTPNSPSHFMGRIAVASFNLPSLAEKWWEEADGSSAVLKKFKAADKTKKRAYIMWEPDVSLALEEPGAIKLLDSSKLSGLVIDVLVVQREFLRDKPELVQQVVEAYFRAYYSIDQKKDGWLNLVLEDAKKTDSSISRKQAEAIVSGIQWKNTLENYAYFRLLGPGEATGLLNLEDCISRIVKEVLIPTDAIPKDNLVSGKEHLLFFNGTLKAMEAGKFHPGKKVQGIDIGLSGSDLTAARVAKTLRPLTEEDWGRLIPVGTLKVESVPFRRGQTKMLRNGNLILTELVAKLKSFPDYYLLVTGHATGATDADRQLAQGRADEVKQFLVSAGISAHRLKTLGKSPDGKGPNTGEGATQSVRFTVGQLPF